MQYRIKKIVEDINTKGLRYIRWNYIKIAQLIVDIKKHIKNKTARMTSQDLRDITILIEKYHKEINKKLSFREIFKKIERHKVVTDEILKEEFKTYAEDFALAKKLQVIVGELNYYSNYLYLQELCIEHNKMEDDKIFNDEITNTIKSLIGDFT